MRFTWALLLSFWATLVPAQACPDYQNPGFEHYVLTGRNLWWPQAYVARAGGDRELRSCGFPYRGHVRNTPDFTLMLSRLDRYDRLHVRINGECDTVILLRDPYGRWFFDDDSGTGRHASLSIADPHNGQYHIWVGTYDAGSCDARLTLETF